MGKNKEYELAIKIAGMIDASLMDACNLTKRQLRSIAKEAAGAKKDSNNVFNSVNAVGGEIDSLWNGATRAIKTTAEAIVGIGAVAGVAGGIVVNVGSDYESAFAGVKKTVNATEQQLADLDEGLREMAKNKPQTAVELAEIAEAAGQLGIHTENIEDFTGTMADLKVATNLGDEGASQFAKFANIVEMSQDKFENLGSTVVALGNNSATTEADIMGMAMRIAGAGHQVNMSEADILGLSASLSSVGIEADAGGSAISKIMVDMQLATEQGGARLEKFAKVANMSGEQFQKAFKEDAAGAIVEFISGLSDTDRLGQSAIATLDDMDIKEVRLRDTLLRASNASGLFSDTLSLASEAFEENTALTKEAEQKYSTFESRVGMVKNRVNDMGITLYKDFRDPLSDCLDMALQFTEDAEIFDPKHIDNMAKSFKKSIPTIVREVGDAKDALVDFAQPIIEIGDWMIENPDVIAGTLVGIGTAITSLKLARTIASVASSMEALKVAMISNPLTAAIGLAALAGGAVVGVSTKIKAANETLKKQKLAEKFGDISLSIGELQEAAKQVLGEKVLDQLGQAMEELGKVSDISDQIKNSTDAINKIMWKISMGWELDDTDMESLGSTISSMVDDSLELVKQAQYTAHININTLFGEGDEVGQQLINGFDAMYENINTEVSELGGRLGKAYNDAMEDGIIDIDEAEVIQELQSRLARVTDKIAQSKTDAKIDRIMLEYSGAEMDADTFQNFQREIGEVLEEATTAANQSYDYDLGALKLRLGKSQTGEISIDDPAYLSQEMYDEAKKALDDKLMERHMELELKNVNFQTKAITDAFSEEINEVAPDMRESLNTVLGETIKTAAGANLRDNQMIWTYDHISDLLNLDSLDNATKDAMKEMWKGLEPQYQDMLAIKKQYTDAGKEIPRSLADSIMDAASIGILAENEGAMWEALGLIAADSPEKQKSLEEMKREGKQVPISYSAGIEANVDAVNKGVDKLYNHAKEYAQNRFDNMKIYGDVQVDFGMNVGKVTTRQSSASNPRGVVVNKHAVGGIFDEPHFGVFAEAGPEAFIPLDGSQNAISIWEKAGEALGTLNVEKPVQSVGSEKYIVDTEREGANAQESIIYAPSYQIYGSSEETVRRATTDDYERFAHFMKEYEKNHRRLSFS